MQPNHERIPLEQTESIRCLYWVDSVSEIYMAQDSHRAHSLNGEGDHWHFHKEFEITCFTQGNRTRIVGDHIEDRSSPEVLLLGSFLPHYWRENGKTSGFSIQFNLTEGSPLSCLPEISFFHQLVKRAKRGIVFKDSCQKKLIKLLATMPNANAAERLGILLNMLNIMNKASQVQWQYISNATFNLKPDDENIAKIQEIIDYIITYCETPMSLDDVAKQLNMSKSTLNRHVRKYTGKSFNQLLIETRLSLVKRQLIETDRSIVEIALGSGFNNISNFNSCFKKYLGATPKEFRSLQLSQKL